MIKCHEHHTSFIRSKGSKRSTQIKWVCKNYLLYNLHGCVSPIISENDLNQIIFLIIKSIKIDEEKIINDLKKYYQKSINKFDITEIRKRQNKLIEMFLNNLITENNYQTINTKYNNEILKINNFEKEINNVINYIKNKTYQNNISDFVHLFIDNILVEKLDNCRNNIHLIISLKHLKLTHEFYFKSLDKNARIKNNFFITVCSI